MGRPKVTHNWIVEVEYPSHLDLEDDVDLLSGMPVQCWGEDREGSKVLRQSYEELPYAMDIALRLQGIKGVSRVDVYDIQYPNG